MIYTENINKALKLITEVHKDQVDKAGIAYILHPYEVANNVYNYVYNHSKDGITYKDIYIEDYVITALLHDVLEDSLLTSYALLALDFSPRIVVAITCLTHNKGVTYNDYIDNIMNNNIAAIVKMFDLKHNMKLRRFDGQNINKRILDKQDTYVKAYHKLYEKVGY